MTWIIYPRLLHFSLEKTLIDIFFYCPVMLIYGFSLVMTSCCWFACCLFLFLISTSVQQERCILPNAFPLTDSRISSRWWIILHDLCFVFSTFFCIQSLPFLGVRCHSASCACLLVAPRCLPDPPNAPLCWYVAMAPSAVGHCPFCVSEVRLIITSVLNSTNSQDYTRETQQLDEGI